MNDVEAAVVLTTAWMERVPITNQQLLNEKAICKAYGEFYRAAVALDKERRAGRLDNLPFEWEAEYPPVKVKRAP